MKITKKKQTKMGYRIVSSEGGFDENGIYVLKEILEECLIEDENTGD